ncbi:8-oxo-dGTP pyrophosphatase MutT, NUDIX family [Microlunatus sagamiharensis]|uniref:8-oxo-dGTP pyrophosphatase MutT, NUDIX family n=1 Tax=Microlunatus sagamiharensis TaxID=546874 RepID=A0A1H2M159_9ACTN|nr:NUDIX domain-containing protein [Microlunatus sagamiharensis]SDU86256.1 8-oxo-dGTP pyrophosphatase MutT, NUDIX family [Microlunatus sagamiharensis]
MDVVTELEQAPADAVRDAFVEFARSRGDAALRRSGGPEHLTASCFVLTRDLRQVLLTHHRKGGFWVQLGGHIESADTSLADAARREAREESGVADLELLSGRVLDLDRHELHGGFSCAAHWDVGFVALASPSAPVHVSSESLDLGWFGVEALPSAVPPGFAERLAVIRGRAAGLLAGSAPVQASEVDRGSGS